MFFLYPYKFGSRSCSSLSQALDGRVIRHENSRFRGAQRKTVINWGSSELPEEVRKCRVINPVEFVKRAGNKLEFFTLLSGSGLVRYPEFTSNPDTVASWLEANRTVVVRKSLTGHSGLGIEILENGLDIPDAPLYTRYIPKDGEYRVHIINQEVVDVQRKVKDPNREVKDWKVRSHDNGFIFIRNTESGSTYKEELTVKNSDVLTQAKAAMKVSGLDFGAVDVIFNKKKGQAFVLEVNCAPGLEGSSIEIYKEAIRRHYG